MIWEATLKPIDVQPTAGDVHRIRVQADSREEAIREVRFHAAFERCSGYAIIKLMEISKK